MEPVVIDNFLSSRYFSRIIEVVESNKFSWNFKKDITFSGVDPSSKYSYGFDSFVIDEYNVENYELFQTLTSFYCDLLDVTKCNSISKSRFDMVTYSPEKYQHTIHVDDYVPHVAAVFYITDSDAETVLYDQQCFSPDQYHNRIDFGNLKVVKEVKPKENRLLFFDGSILHTGRSPSEYKNRIIINSNLTK